MSAPGSAASSRGSLDNRGQDYREPGLAELATYFLASKRSLSSISHVSRANELVTAAREALEENAALAATNTYIRQALSNQITTVQAIQHGAETVSAEIHEDFQSVVAACDEHSNALNAAINVLRNTSVEVTAGPDSDAARSLFDYMDESGVADLHNAVRASIDRYNDAQGSFEDRIEEHGGIIADVRGSLVATSLAQRPNAGDISRHIADAASATTGHAPAEPVDASPLPDLFAELEAHASECAALLQSLVRNYDLCVTALKHTEGGGAAIEQVEGAVPTDPDIPSGLGLGLQLPHLDTAGPPQQSISEEDRAEMLAVLQRDAGEVDDVVREIAERLADMETLFGRIDAFVSGLRGAAQRLHATLRRLVGVVAGLEGYIAAADAFVAFWAGEREVLVERQGEFVALGELYENFSLAYESLVLEMHRRRGVQVAMERAVRDVQKRLEVLWRDDVDERTAWGKEWGEFLPSDIWAGINEPPSRYEVRRVEGLQDLPKVGKDVLERARKRLGVNSSSGATAVSGQRRT